MDSPSSTKTFLRPRKSLPPIVQGVGHHAYIDNQIINTDPIYTIDNNDTHKSKLTWQNSIQELTDPLSILRGRPTLCSPNTLHPAL